MDTQPAQIAKYLHQTLGIDVAVRAWKACARLPVFLRQAYEFYELEILGRPCLAMVDRVDEEVSPTTIRKHAEYLLAKFPGDVINWCCCICCCTRVRATRRRRRWRTGWATRR